jgi:hypothetical protein
MNEQMQPKENPIVQKEEKRSMFRSGRFWLITCVIIVICGIAAAIIMQYRNSDIYNACTGCGNNETLSLIEKFNKYMYELKCAKSGSESKSYKNYFVTCAVKSPLAGRDCLQNSDCQGGACIPSAIPTDSRFRTGLGLGDWQDESTLRVNAEGYVLGSCSENKYSEESIPNSRYCNVYQIYAPSLASKPGENISTVDCEGPGFYSND